MPEALLRNVSLDEMTVDEFLGYIAMARYIQQKEADIHAAAISRAME